MNDLSETGYVVLESVFPRDLCTYWKERLQSRCHNVGKEGESSSSSSSSSASIDKAGHDRARLNPDPADRSRAHKIQSVALAEPGVLDLFRHERIVATAKRAMAGNSDKYHGPLDVFGTKFFPMWPKTEGAPGGTSVGWHQDSYYFGSGADEAACVSSAIYLEDTCRANGCLRVIPNSHEPGWDGGAAADGRPPLPRTEDGILVHRPGEGRWAHGDWIPDCPDDDAVDVEVPAGSAVLFDPRLVHSAHANESSGRTRASLFGHLVHRSVTFAKDDRLDFTFGKYSDRHQIAD